MSHMLHVVPTTDIMSHLKRSDAAVLCFSLFSFSIMKTREMQSKPILVFLDFFKGACPRNPKSLLRHRSLRVPPKHLVGPCGTVGSSKSLPCSLTSIWPSNPVIESLFCSRSILRPRCSDLYTHAVPDQKT